MTKLTLAEVARAAGVTVETLRSYERRGLIPTPLTPGSSGRAYPESTLGRVKFIRQARHVGFTLDEIAELVSIRTHPDGQCPQVLERVQAKAAEVTEHIALLRKKLDLLAKAISACPAQGPASDCPIFGTFESACSDQK